MSFIRQHHGDVDVEGSLTVPRISSTSTTLSCEGAEVGIAASASIHFFQGSAYDADESFLVNAPTQWMYADDDTISIFGRDHTTTIYSGAGDASSIAFEHRGLSATTDAGSTLLQSFGAGKLILNADANASGSGGTTEIQWQGTPVLSVGNGITTVESGVLVLGEDFDGTDPPAANRVNALYHKDGTLFWNGGALVTGGNAALLDQGVSIDDSPRFLGLTINGAVEDPLKVFQVNNTGTDFFLHSPLTSQSVKVYLGANDTSEQLASFTTTGTRLASATGQSLELAVGTSTRAQFAASGVSYLSSDGALELRNGATAVATFSPSAATVLASQGAQPLQLKQGNTTMAEFTATSASSIGAVSGQSMQLKAGSTVLGDFSESDVVIGTETQSGLSIRLAVPPSDTTSTGVRVGQTHFINGTYTQLCPTLTFSGTNPTAMVTYRGFYPGTTHHFFEVAFAFNAQAAGSKHTKLRSVQSASLPLNANTSGVSDATSLTLPTVGAAETVTFTLEVTMFTGTLNNWSLQSIP
jgi:hypothetical protein